MSAMAAGPDRVQEERHNQNLHQFKSLNEDVRKNSEQTGRALAEVSSVRHDVKNLRQTVEDFIWLYREEKKERKAELDEQARDRKKEMDEQAKRLEQLSHKFIWACGLIAGLSIAFHFIFDVLSPLTRHLLQ